jgi:hypothetical protein
MTRLAAAVLPLLASGCAMVRVPAGPLTERDELRTEAGTFHLSYARGDEGSRDALERAIRLASPRLLQWGALKVPVKVAILPSHEALVAAVPRHDYDWLRAWARYDEVFVQSPRTWSLLGARVVDVDELMLHELTHCVMYQRSATAETWSGKQIPPWFREGMASVTASQGSQWPSLEDLAASFAEHRDEDPVGDPGALYRGRKDVAYGAAHHAFEFLLRRYGPKAVRAVMDEMSEGAAFPEAFQAATGISAAAFIEDFRRFVRMRGFRPPRGQAPFLSLREILL